MLPSDLKPDIENTPSQSVPAQTNEIINTLKSLLNDPIFINKVAAARIVKRPPHASKLSNFSYYRQMFGLEARTIMDGMISDKHDREWKFSDYANLKASSLYQRVYQSFNFLVREMDYTTPEYPEGYYSHFKSMMVMTKEKTGIRLSWIRDRLEGRAFSPSVVEDYDKISEWKEKIEAFLVDPTKEILHLKQLSLTIEQIKELQATFSSIESVMAVVTEREIKIVKDKSMLSDVKSEATD